MRFCLLAAFLLLPSSAAAQEGVIIYSGHQTMQLGRDFLLASIPEALQPDPAMIEALLEEAITTPLNWEVRFSGPTVLGGMNMADLIPEIDSASPGMTPFTGGMQSLGSMNFETYIDYESGAVISSLPSFMEEPYLVTQELDSTMIMDWELGSRDSTIMGYTVRMAKAESSPAQIEAAMSQIASGAIPRGDMMPQMESGVFTAWYTPEIPTPAGPMMIGGLPGAVLYLVGEISMEGSSVVLEVSAESVETTLDKPVQPPSGTPISQEDYTEMMRLRMDMLFKQMQDMQ